ncbi:MAG: formylglycine-generating enzyme family protein [bacterium]
MHPSTRRRFLRNTVLASPALLSVPGWTFPVITGEAENPVEFVFEPEQNIIPAPRDPAQGPAFRQRLHEWRDATRRRLNYSDALYRRDDFAWVKSCFSCCFLMMYDESFYDGREDRYRVEEFLDHGRREFGGYDAVVLWHAYPRIGADDRNQFDFYRDMPGGLAGLRELSRAFHGQNVKVFVDYNPWDTGTRREEHDDLDALAALVQALEADGIFLDTMSRGAAGFRARLDAVRPGVVLEGEIALPLENLHDHHMSWAQWFEDSPAPGVMRNKWFERRHQQHQIKRWEHDHSGELHCAWMNGSGMMIWENVFGSWVGWNARDRSILRSMLPIQRRYADLFSGEGWTPLVPTLAPGIYASLWESEGLQLWTLVNRSQNSYKGPLLQVESRGAGLVLDLIRGREARVDSRDGATILSGTLGPRGIGCFVSGESTASGADFEAFLQGQAGLAARADFETVFPARETRRVAVRKTAPVSTLPEGMVEIPAAELTLEVVFRIRECGFYDSSSQPLAAGNLHQPAVFQRPAQLERFAIDLTPVTNAQYAEFLRVSGYRPQHPENFLKHWNGGQPPAELEDHPVVYVDLEDARAYAAWAGKRLPTEDEWQFAAQGREGFLYPWGNEMRPDRCNGGELGGTTPVTAYPEGRSPFGCYDLCGNTWEWTESEHRDGRTRFAILKGGSYYAARGSDWYFDGGPQTNRFAAKFLLLWPGLDRCATIGFRCVKDLV